MATQRRKDIPGLEGQIRGACRAELAETASEAPSSRCAASRRPSVSQRHPSTPPRPATARQRPRLRLGGSWQTYVRITFVLLVVLGCLVGFWALLRLPQLTVTPSSTQIGGSQRISAEEIFAASQVEGHNIMLIRPADVAQRVTALPGIAAADVHVRLPNQVLIDVREHLPLVAWQGITTTVWLSAEGAEVPQAGAPAAAHLTDKSGVAAGRKPADLAGHSAAARRLPAATTGTDRAVLRQIRGALFPYAGRLDGVAGQRRRSWPNWHCLKPPGAKSRHAASGHR